MAAYNLNLEPVVGPPTSLNFTWYKQPKGGVSNTFSTTPPEMKPTTAQHDWKLYFFLFSKYASGVEAKNITLKTSYDENTYKVTPPFAMVDGAATAWGEGFRWGMYDLGETPSDGTAFAFNMTLTINGTEYIRNDPKMIVRPT